MNNKEYKDKVKKIITKAKQKGKIKDYSKFCENENAEKYILSERESEYYIKVNNARKGDK